MDKVLITGLGTGMNKGDYMYHTVNINNLKKLGYEPVLFACNPNLEKKFFKDVKVVKHSRKNILKSFWIITCALLRIKNKELEHYLNASAVYDLSGDTLTMEYGFANLVSHSIPLLICNIIGKKYYIMHQTISDYKLPNFLLKNAELIIAREKITYDYLTKELNLKNVILSKDLAFDFQGQKSQRLNSIMKEFNLKKGNYSVVVPATWKNNVNNNKQVNGILKIQKFIIDTLNNKKKVVILCHTKDDIKECEHLQSFYDKDVYYIKTTAEEAKYIIQNSNELMSMRLHACISGLSTGVKTQGISYGRKFKGVFNNEKVC